MIDRQERLADLVGGPVSRETLEHLETFENLLRKWTRRINLVSRSTLDDVWDRHILDSAQLFPLAPPDASSWCDLGSGAGFPGLVVALLARDLRPDLQVSLVEADGRKAEFLRTVLRETGIEAHVIVARIEDVAAQGATVLSARALAPLSQLLAHAERHLATHGVALFPKGATHAEELRAALAFRDFRCEKIPSKTDPEAVIFRISELTRA